MRPCDYITIFSSTKLHFPIHLAALAIEPAVAAKDGGRGGGGLFIPLCYFAFYNLLQRRHKKSWPFQIAFPHDRMLNFK